MKSIARIAILVLLALGVVACGDDDTDETPANVVEAAREDGRFTTLVGALEATDLDEVLINGDGWTVFAPTDAAFDLLPAGLVAGLSPGDLEVILLYHVLPTEQRAADVVLLDSAPTAEGRSITIQVSNDTVVLDGRVQVTKTDIITGNGTIHVIDAVLIPGDFPGTIVDAVVASPRFSTLGGAVVGEMLDGTLAGENAGDGYTVFAPTNDAFDRLPPMLVATLAASSALDDVLLYHVIDGEVNEATARSAAGTSVPTLAPDGGGFYAVAVDTDGDDDLFLDGRTQVTFTDIQTTNGIIHVIDSVLVPGVDFPGTTVEALAAYPRFDSLVDAVLDEGLAGAITNVTVFAPTNDAFASADLMGQPLSAVLPYHVLGDVVDSGSLGATETTLQGSTISINAGMGSVMINGTSNVIFADVATTDGIIHVIDEVLVPPAAP